MKTKNTKKNKPGTTPRRVTRSMTTPIARRLRSNTKHVVDKRMKKGNVETHVELVTAGTMGTPTSQKKHNNSWFNYPPAPKSDASDYSNWLLNYPSFPKKGRRKNDVSIVQRLHKTLEE